MTSRRPERVVLSSSSSVYGEAPTFPMPEDGPLLPISPYGVTKLAGEHLGRLYALAFGLPVVALRYFTVYGPRQRPDMAFHRFFAAILGGRPVGVYGDGEQTRDFTYVDDAIEANLLAAERGVPGESYNVSGGSRVSVLTVLRVMERIAEGDLRIEHLAAQKGDPRHTGGDSTKAREALGFVPRVDLETGLIRMHEWMRRYLEGLPE